MTDWKFGVREREDRIKGESKDFRLLDSIMIRIEC